MNEGLSLAQSKKVCGYTIKKMPIGAYLSALEKLRGLPTELMDSVFPGMDVFGVVARLSRITNRELENLLDGLLVIAPAYLLEFIAELTGIPVERLRDDENVGAAGLVDIVNAFIEVNGLGKLRAGVMEIVKNMAFRPSFGYKG